MKKFSVIFIICSSLACNALGQQDMGYSQNMFNQMTVNPGYAGSMDMISINALVRNQWMGIVSSGAPLSTLFSINAPFTMLQRSHGVGLSIINNTIAFNRDLGLKLSYAYRSKMKFGDGKIGIGLSIGYISSKIDFNKILAPLGGFGKSGTDNALPTGNSSKGTYDVGTGIYYNTEKLYMGISATHLVTGNLDFASSNAGSTTATNTLDAYYYIPHIYITAGYNYQLSNPMLEIVPSFFIQTTGSITVINFNTNIVYNNRVWGGLSYRSDNAISALFGLELAEGVRFGVAYDYETSEIGKISDGSLEVAVIYSFKLKKEKLPQRYKSIRFL
jgi:type IX secretion system PorP/SprF family membrane protein